ncbi:CHC2 zinc finger domain-containing protein [Paraburkholderia dipogonis]|jgi:DNA primase|uniref:CHC2 zinc finger domain-containing protein n=1 Tax=Paraburkholderia dipogonis TaxID=1211383 RepID=UPI0038BA853D
MKRSKFNRDALPPVADVLGLLDLTPTRQNGSGYAQVRCPLHGEQNPSLSIHMKQGNWRCFACGEAGGDVLGLYQRARGLSFPQAARELGAWRGDERNS